MIKLTKPSNLVTKMKEKLDDLLHPIQSEFDVDYTKKKTVEECCELATALMQNTNKKRVFNDQQIEDEIADVLMWVNELAKHYNLDYINARIEKKKTNYFKNGKLFRDYL